MKAAATEVVTTNGLNEIELHESTGPDRAAHAQTIYPLPADLPIDTAIHTHACPPQVRSMLLKIVELSRMETFPRAGMPISTQVKTYQIARKHGPIMKVSDLAKFTRKELADIPFLGDSKMRAVSLFLRRQGVTFKGSK